MKETPTIIDRWLFQAKGLQWALDNSIAGLKLLLALWKALGGCGGEVRGHEVK
jgi:hypothetical protein